MRDWALGLANRISGKLDLLLREDSPPLVTSNSTPAPDAVPAWSVWLTQWPGSALAFLWGFAEGTLFFILPDVPLSLAALYRPRRALLQAVAIVCGAVLAGAVMFLWASYSPSARLAVAHVPLVRPGMFQRSEADYARFGIWAVSLGPIRGIPYKVYAVEAPEHCGLGSFLLVSVPARMMRLLVVWLIFAAAGAVLRALRRVSLAPVLHGLVWIVVYVAYWAKVR